MIVVDGGSSDQTLSVARQAGCRTIAGPRGRSRQMNRGAAAARGELLLFVHADTLLPDHFRQQIANNTYLVTDLCTTQNGYKWPGWFGNCLTKVLV